MNTYEPQYRFQAGGVRHWDIGRPVETGSMEEPEILVSYEVTKRHTCFKFEGGSFIFVSHNEPVMLYYPPEKDS